MEPTKLSEQINFLREIEKLKTIERANKTLDGRYENSAEHSWHVALMACVLENDAETKIDMLKVIKLLLVHDLVEIDAGDTWLYADNQNSKLDDETKAAERLFSLLPDCQRSEYMNLWMEFENRSTEEAKFAYVIDGIQPLLNHVMTGDAKDGIIPVTKVREKKSYICEFAPELWNLVEELIDEGYRLGLYE